MACRVRTIGGSGKFGLSRFMYRAMRSNKEVRVRFTGTSTVPFSSSFVRLWNRGI